MAMEGSTLAAGSRQGLAAPLRVLGDEALMRLAARGNQAAFAAIFDRHHQALYRYSLTILGNEEDAFDAVQNAVVKLLRSLPGEQRDLKLKPWLYRIVHNESISMIRQRAPRSETTVEEAVTDDSPDDRLRAQAIIADLAMLGDQQRSAVAMRELNGLSHAEIGGALKISEAAAKQAVYEGRVALQQIEEGREMACSEIQNSLSANDRRLIKGRRVRSHLRSCPACRAFQESIRERRAGLAGIAPLPAALSAKLLSGALGGGGGPAGGLMIGAGAGTGHVLGAGALAKVGAAAVLMIGGGIVIDREVGQSNAAPRAERTGRVGATAEQPQPEVSAASAQAASATVRAGHTSPQAKAADHGGRRSPEHQTADSAQPTGGPRADLGDRPGGSGGGGRSSGVGGGGSGGSGGSAGHGAGASGTETPVAEPAQPASPAHPTGPAHGQAIAASHDPGDPGNSAGHAQDPASPPGLSGQAATPHPPATPAVPSAPDLPIAANGHGQGLEPK
jgi:RNA polymerase sigma factor (sigma-70 family)